MSIKKIHIKSTFIKATTFSSGFSNLSVGSITDGSNNVLVILRERGGHECHTNYYHYYILQLLCTLGNSSEYLRYARSACFVYTLHTQQK